MNTLSGSSLLLLGHALLFASCSARAQQGSPATQQFAPVQSSPATIPGVSTWSSTDAQHVQGFPDVRPKDHGALQLTATEVVFTGKKSHSVIPRSSITAVSAGDQRVEIWGMKGRVLRAVMPNGSGVVGAMFMHHRVDMLTVEFVDGHGSHRAAVFFLPGQKAAAALDAFARQPMLVANTPQEGCTESFVRPKSLLIRLPEWDAAQVPPAYRALLYERLEERMRKVEGVDRVYRDGEQHPGQGCPAYTLQLSVSGFKEGSQVKRAILGPVGFFAGTTQMKFDAKVTDAEGVVHLQKRMSATTRGESESTGVTDDVAKKLAKEYGGLLRAEAKTEALARSNEAAHRPAPYASFQ